MPDDLIIPHDLDAERAFLGAILIDGSLYSLAAGELDRGDFYRHVHRYVWDAMTRVHQAGSPIDFMTVKAALEQSHHLDEVGIAYLASLVDGVPKTVNVAHYGEIVRTKGDARAFQALLVQSLKDVSDHGVTRDALESLRAVADSALTGSRVASVAYEQALRAELGRERVRRDARKRLDAEARPVAPIPAFETLAERLSRPKVTRIDRIDGYQPMGARVMAVAQYKAGKTTLVGNLSRSLLDGDPFLDIARVAPLTGTLALIDFEMSETQIDDWLRAQQIRSADRMLIIPMRGKASAFNILDAEIRADWALRLKTAGVEYLIVDCLRPILDALGLDEHKDAGRFLVALDALLNEAGVREALVVHHMGHGAERARGDSRLRDWPDAEWRLVRHTDQPDSARVSTAYGRDVDVPESLLAYNSSTRRLSLAGGSRREAAGTAALDDVMALLREAGPLSGRKILAGLKDSEHTRAAIQQALTSGCKAWGGLTATKGERNATLYSIDASAPVRRSAPSVSRITPATECASAPVLIKHGARSTGSEVGFAI